MIKVGIVCGGPSNEHEISCISARGILSAIDRTKFQPVLVGITKLGKWVLPPENYSLEVNGDQLPEIKEELPATSLSELNLDIFFPVLHGTYGEDGGFQQDCENLKKKYVGSGVTASANGMDKSNAKILFRSQGLATANGIVATLEVWQQSPEKILSAAEPLGFPLFVKPSSSGSSRGTSKVKNSSDLKRAIDVAFGHDDKVLIEETVNGREIECAILEQGNELLASPPGEIKVLGDHEFYDFEAKYLDGSTQLIVPAKLSDSEVLKIQAAAKTAFRALECKDLARVDFFYDEGKLVINEINTIPGFTATSMYPRMWEAGGIKYQRLITLLIENALARY